MAGVIRVEPCRCTHEMVWQIGQTGWHSGHLAVLEAASKGDKTRASDVRPHLPRNVAGRPQLSRFVDQRKMSCCTQATRVLADSSGNTGRWRPELPKGVQLDPAMSK